MINQVDSINESLELGSMNRQTAYEYLTYVDALYNNEADIAKSLRLLRLKAKILKRIVQLDKQYLAQVNYHYLK